MPLQATSGAASYDGFGGGVPVAANYIEDVFSTWLYTGNGSTQTITNGIDLSTKGGLVWGKDRINAGTSHILIDTNRWSAGANALLYSDLTNSQQGYTQAITAFSTTGFTLGNGVGVGGNNASGTNYVSWTFRKQPKFFDVVTWTGDGNSSSRIISHSLGATPGFLIIKCTSTSTNWNAFCRVNSTTLAWMYLNTTQAASSVGGTPSYTTLGITSTGIDVAKIWLNSPAYPGAAGGNASGETYVAYLFAHNAGGFGLTGTDNVISCGSFTTDGSGNATINLGYEPQWFLRKRTDDVGSWTLVDNMRGFTAGGTDAFLYPNLSNAEATSGGSERLTSTGVQITGFGASMTFIYIAIRRGPMKTPTTGTSVYEGTAYTGNGASNRQIGSSVLTDLLLLDNRDATAQSWSTYAQMFFDRLRGDDVLLATASTNAESTSWNSYIDFDMNAGWDTGPTTQQTYLNKTSSTYVSHAFRRAPGFFDVVCYTGNGTFGATNHNLGVIPELVIYKKRSGTAQDWGAIYYLSSISYRFGNLNLTDAFVTYSNDPAVAGLFSSTQFCKYYDTSGQTYVAYLFASCPGVSKVGSYTGTGALQTINCGFTGGARFVLIKRTDSTGDWFTYDSARGITSGNDPYLLMNSTAAEVTGTNYVDTDSTGFKVTAAAPAGLNASGGTYIFLAIA